MEDYLAESSQATNQASQVCNEELQVSAKQHKAFSGSIQDYLASFSESAKEENNNPASKSPSACANDKTAIKPAHK